MVLTLLHLRMFKEISTSLSLPEDLSDCTCRFYKEEIFPLESSRIRRPVAPAPEFIAHVWIEAPTWLAANLVKEYCFQKLNAPNHKFEYDMKKMLNEPSELICIMEKPINVSEMITYVRSQESELSFRLQRQYCETIAIRDNLSWCEENGISPRVHFINLRAPIVELEFKFDAPEDKVLFDLRWRNN